MNHFIDIGDATREELNRVVDVAIAMRDARRHGRTDATVLAGRTYAMIFEKPSLRTRASFEQAVVELGGHAMNLAGIEVGLGQREPTADVARVLVGMVDGIAARVYSHDKLHALAVDAGTPVINLLSDRSHPCQALADLLTMIDEFGRDLAGRKLAFIGDGNNVAFSLSHLCLRMDVHFVLASPEGFALPDAAVAEVLADAKKATYGWTDDPIEAVEGADVIYTDTWVSMGQESDQSAREDAFSRYQVNESLLAAAPDHAIVMHCLPAYRGREITDAVIEGPRSRVFPEAHNRLHAQKGLLAVLAGAR